jgi:hypothetical protein
LKRLIKITLITVAVLAGLAGLSLLAINLYIQSPEIQLRLRKAVSDTIGYPINVFRITFFPWSGFHLQNISIENPELHVPLLKARDLRVRCEYLPLLRNTIIIRQIVLTSPEIRVSIVKHAESNLLPESGPSESIAFFNPSLESADGSSSSLPVPQATSATKLKARKEIPGNFWGKIRKGKIRDGSIYFMGPNSTPIAMLRKVESNIDFHKSDYLGKIDISSATLSNSVNMEKISSPLKISNGALDLEKINASISGGTIHGYFHLNLIDSELSYQLQLEANAINVNQIISPASGILDRTHGSLKGKFRMTGAVNNPSLAQGTGTFDIKDGYLDQYPVLQEIGRWTQIDELQRLNLDTASISFSVDGQDIRVEDFKVTSKNCQVALLGIINSAQKLALNGRLTVSQFLNQKIPNELKDNFVTAPDGQNHYLDFQVTGSIIKPRTNLFDRLIGDKNRLLKKVLRGNRKKKRQNKDQE